MAVVIVALLAGNAAVLVDRQKAKGSEASPAAPTSAAAKELEATLPALQAFVEQTRGVKFTSKPRVELLADEQFDALLHRMEAEATAAAGDEVDDDATIGLLRALGLVQGEVDLSAVTNDQISSVVGFYDDETKRLYVRGVAPTPYVKKVLVHELTHALDDQRFGLRRDDLDDEADAAFTALVEGSASMVEKRWYDSRTDEEKAAIDAEEEQGSTAYENLPEVILNLMAFPYQVGEMFVDELVKTSASRLNFAFAAPPTTTEQVLHFDKYTAKQGAREVAEPAADGEIVDSGTIGELGLLLMFDGLKSEAGYRAAEGWGGDHYVAWRNGAGQTCARFNLVMDTPSDTTEALNALRSWARGRRGATVTGTNPITVTNCA